MSGPSRAHLLALFILSAAILALEVLLLRTFQYSHWHHFAGLAIALALLGFGAAGTLLTLVGPRPAAGEDWFTGSVLFTALSIMALIQVQSRIALRPMLAGWDSTELVRLLLVDASAFAPFFAAGLALGHAFVRWPRHPRRVYAANLLGSGTGSAAASLALCVMDVEAALALCALVLSLLGVGLAVLWRQRHLALLAVLACAVGTMLAVQPPGPALSDFKPLARLLELPDVEQLERKPGLHGSLRVLRSDALRIAPGLSLGWQVAVPPVDVAVIGSERVVALPRRWPGRADHDSASLPAVAAALRPAGRVLAIGAGRWGPTGRGEATLTWVEGDARIHALALQRSTSSRTFEAVVDSAFRHLTMSPTRYDIIAVDRAYEGGDPAGEDYLLTVEGLQLALSRLKADGLLAIPLQLHYPPRHFPRLLSTVHAALQRQGATRPGQHVAALRGLRAMLVLVSPRPLPASDLRQLRNLARRWSFDLVWLPGLERGDANQHHLLEAPVFHDVARAVLHARRMPSAASSFETGPADLDRPYFWRSLKWSRAPELLQNMGQRALSYLDWPLLLSVATACAVVVLALFLILVPLPRLPAPAPGAPARITMLAFFGALGMGYMLLEMAIFQRSILFLGEPVLCASVVFATFLVGSGFGAVSAPHHRRRRAVLHTFAALALGGMLAVGGLWAWTRDLLALPFPARVVCLIALIAPLAFALGRPFPWGLRQLAGSPAYIPWAWGINAFASVLAASLASLVSVHAGQRVTLLGAAACYTLVLVVALGWTRAPVAMAQASARPG